MAVGPTAQASTQRNAPHPHSEPPDPNRRERQIELEILHLLTDREDNQPVWALDDLAREMGLPDAVDYIRRLERSGLCPPHLRPARLCESRGGAAHSTD